MSKLGAYQKLLSNPVVDSVHEKHPILDDMSWYTEQLLVHEGLIILLFNTKNTHIENRHTKKDYG